MLPNSLSLTAAVRSGAVQLWQNFVLASVYCTPKTLWVKMRDLVYLAGVFSWAAKSPPLLSLCTCAFLILLVVFCSENITCSKRNDQKNNPFEEKPTMLPWQMVLGTAPVLAADTPQPPRYPARLFQDIPSALSSSAPGAGRAGGCLHLSPQMPAPAGCFVSVALLLDLCCFLPCGCNWRKSQHVGCVPAAVMGWGQHCGSLCPGTCPPWQ